MLRRFYWAPAKSQKGVPNRQTYGQIDTCAAQTPACATRGRFDSSQEKRQTMRHSTSAIGMTRRKISASWCTSESVITLHEFWPVSPRLNSKEADPAVMGTVISDRQSPLSTEDRRHWLSVQLDPLLGKVTTSVVDPSPLCALTRTIK